MPGKPGVIAFIQDWYDNWEPKLLLGSLAGLAAGIGYGTYTPRSMGPGPRVEDRVVVVTAAVLALLSVKLQIVMRNLKTWDTAPGHHVEPNIWMEFLAPLNMWTFCLVCAAVPSPQALPALMFVFCLSDLAMCCLYIKPLRGYARGAADDAHEAVHVSRAVKRWIIVDAAGGALSLAYFLMVLLKLKVASMVGIPYAITLFAVTLPLDLWLNWKHFYRNPYLTKARLAGASSAESTKEVP